MAPTQQLRRVKSPAWRDVSRSPHARAGHAPRPRVADALALLAGVGLGVVIALVGANESLGALASPGGWFIGAGRLFGFTGTYLLIVMIVLIARLPWLERTVGQDRLVHWHRRIGPWPIVLISLHVVSITLGYAQVTRTGPLHQLDLFLFHYPNLLAAMVAFALIVLAGLSSVRLARRHQKYETWWVVHLYTYVALALAFAHQITTGALFLTHPLSRDFWITLWVATAVTVLASRLGGPVVRNRRLQLRVAQVHELSPGTYSLTISGRGLERLAVSGGQFFQWRFLTRGLWFHAHPYSLSALPRPPFLRVTVKAVGDQSSALAQVKPGTRVVVEGPYGTFTHHARTTDSLTLIGAGVGITPLRALLEDLPAAVAVTVIVRASSSEDLVHRDELYALAHARGGAFHELLGAREDVTLDATTLSRLAPHLGDGDVYVCGPSGFADRVVDVARQLGVAPALIHREAFSF